MYNILIAELKLMNEKKVLYIIKENISTLNVQHKNENYQGLIISKIKLLQALQELKIPYNLINMTLKNSYGYCRQQS